MQPGSIVSLQLCIGSRQPMSFVQEARAIADLGLEGDRHARSGSHRQILIMDGETLGVFDLQPGEVRENITTQGIELYALDPGSVLHIGQEVALKVTGLCEPCQRMDEVRPGLQSALQGQRGIITTVLKGGTLRLGDSVRVES